MKNYIKFVKRNIRRNPYQALAATMVMLLTFFVLSTFLLLALGSQQILKYYESKPQAIAFFKDGTDENDVKAIENALFETGKITSFKFVSKEEALQIYKERNKNNPILLELVTANILPASLEISALSPEDLKPISQILKREPVVEEVVFPEDVVSSLTQATRLIRIIGGSTVGFLITFSTLMIVMVIGFKIRVKRDEIETMKLLGASKWFIRTPFLLEGIIYASAGSFLGWFGSLAIVWYFEPLLKSNLGEVGQILLPIPFLVIFGLLLLELLAAILIGVVGSAVAVRRYLQL